MSQNLLVITPTYTNFVKVPVEKMADHFDTIYVMVRLNPVTELSNYLPINYLKMFSKKACLDLSNLPANIKIIPTPVYYAPFKNSRNHLFDRHFKIVDKIIRDNNIKFDIIHAHFTSTSGYVGALLKNKYKKPLVITVHENQEWFENELNSNDDKIKYAWKNADAIVRVNKADIAKLKSYNKNVLFIPNGFDSTNLKIMDKSEARKILGLPVNNKIIFSLGKLIERKGYNYLIDAMSLIIDERKDVSCYIAGHGTIKNKLHKQISKLKLDEYVKLVDFIPNSSIPAWMNASDIFVLPSLSEGNPTVMFESLGCGLPFIGTEVGGVPEVIISEDYGSIVKPKDSIALSQMILDGLNKSWDKQKIKNYASQFAWEKISNQYLTLYKKLTDHYGLKCLENYVSICK
jgi:teichuronic acid biosynthesis glycosyltransferase TuaC